MKNCSLILALTLMALVTVSPAAEAKLDLILMNAESLAQARDSVRAGNSPLKAAYDRLLRDAQKAMSVRPASVMDKTKTPASGDKHDFYSIGPYYWPNPNTPNGLPYISKDGVSNPERSTDAYDPGRAGKIFKAIEILALAYYFSGDESYAGHATTLLKTWYLDQATRMNPNLNYAQVNPGRDKVTGTGIIDTVGMIGIPDAITLLSGSKNLTPEDLKGLKAWFGQYTDWLLNSEKGKLEQRAKNNHGVWFAAQTSTYALFVNRPDVGKTLAESGKVQIAAQIEVDGRMPLELKRTKSFHYSVFNLEAFFQLATAGQHAGVDLWNYTTPDGRSLRKAFNFVAQFSDPAKKWGYQEIQGYKSDSLYPLILSAGVNWKDTALLQTADKLQGDEQKKDRIRLLVNR